MKKPNPKGVDSIKAASEDPKKTDDAKNMLFPIVGMGASAGGLEAFEQFFSIIPPNSGMAFVLVTHLAPDHTSMLSEILQRHTDMTVKEARDGIKVRPNSVYIIPPGQDMTISKGILHLKEPKTTVGLRLPIDLFFRSLAKDQAERSICVILSGGGSDGTLGLRAINGAGGVSFVQEPSTAKYQSMPTKAIESGLATFIMPINEIVNELISYVKNYSKLDVSNPPKDPVVIDAMLRIIMLINSKTGNDFSKYKQSTVKRRIERRMGIHGLNNMSVYLRHLQENPVELQTLFEEIVINVTHFFRDPQAFESMREKVLPKLFENVPDDHVFRIWVPGCSSGEEAYSLGILFHEYMETINKKYKIQIYATDIDLDSISTARMATYPESISSEVTPERLERYFKHNDNGLQIVKEIREMVVFAIQNVIKDPPFTRMDLISCRNLFIYFDTDLQNRVIPLFHYALRRNAFLFLSPSEGIGNYSNLFEPFDKKWKIFTAKPTEESAKMIATKGYEWNEKIPKQESVAMIPEKKNLNFADLIRQALLRSYAPPSVITDKNGDIVYVHGETGRYLRPAPGNASLNVVDMAREELQSVLRSALQNVIENQKMVLVKEIHIEIEGVLQTVDILVQKLDDKKDSDELLLVSFQDSTVTAVDDKKQVKRATKIITSKRLKEMEQELTYTKENLQATIEEMQAANEELQSTNEELQSTNEELETTQEEIQAVNEEMLTVNSELQIKIEELTGVQNDMKNLFDNIDVALIILDDRLEIKRFNDEALKLYRLVSSDVGRPLADIRSLIFDVDLLPHANNVLDTLVPQEKTIKTNNDEWFKVSINPYRTLDNKIDGVVLTFSKITSLKLIEKELRFARNYADNIIDTVREPLIILNAEFEVVSASKPFYTYFMTNPGETVGKSFFSLGDGQWDVSLIRQMLESILPEQTNLVDIEVEHTFPKIGQKKMLLNAREIMDDTKTMKLILISIEDVTPET